MSFRIRLPAEQAAVVLKAIEAAREALDGQDLEDVSAETHIALINDPPAYPDEDISAETFRSHWDGAAPDYSTAIEVLDEYARASRSGG